jgi:hypothetical protein
VEIPLPIVAETVEKMLPANCIPSPESPEKRTTTRSNSFTSNSFVIICKYKIFVYSAGKYTLNSRHNKTKYGLFSN